MRFPDMSDKPLVSAITIFLNGENFIEEAIQSVLAQTYSNWELLLVDDGSTDGSTEIARRYVREYPGRIRYVEHPLPPESGYERVAQLRPPPR
jgi:glycosyltransferase involved in cell wall biosynthesis